MTPHVEPRNWRKGLMFAASHRAAVGVLVPSPSRGRAAGHGCVLRHLVSFAIEVDAHRDSAAARRLPDSRNCCLDARRLLRFRSSGIAGNYVIYLCSPEHTSPSIARGRQP